MGAFVEDEVLKEIDESLTDLERRTSLLKFRQEKGLGLKAVEKSKILVALSDPELRRRTTLVVPEGQLVEIIRSFWQLINSDMRTGGIKSHRTDHFQNGIEISHDLGIQTICFIQEGYPPPSVGVDLFFDPVKRIGVEAYINSLGGLIFVDPDLNQAWPENVKSLIQASALAHYAAIVCPRLESAEIDTDSSKEDISGPKPKKKKRKLKHRRPHLRRLSGDKRGTFRQLALAISSGAFSVERIEKIIKAGRHRTFVKEFKAESVGDGKVDPLRLYGRISPVRFLNTYISLVREA